jgi:hypothetical protein
MILSKDIEEHIGYLNYPWVLPRPYRLARQSHADSAHVEVFFLRRQQTEIFGQKVGFPA